MTNSLSAVKAKSFTGKAVARPRAMKAVARKNFRVSASTGVFFSTTTGNTEEVAGAVAEGLGADDPVEIGEVEDLSELLEFDNLVVGAPTWNTGADDSRSGTSWDDMLEELAGMDFSGKKVAVFGCGDSSSYSDYFVDAIEEIHSTFSGAGATMVGTVSTDGYEFENSKSCVGGPQSSGDASEMLGLAIDVENQDDMTEDRVAGWVSKLQGEF